MKAAVWLVWWALTLATYVAGGWWLDAHPERLRRAMRGRARLVSLLVAVSSISLVVCGLAWLGAGSPASNRPPAGFHGIGTASSHKTIAPAPP